MLIGKGGIDGCPGISPLQVSEPKAREASLLEGRLNSAPLTLRRVMHLFFLFCSQQFTRHVSEDISSLLFFLSFFLFEILAPISYKYSLQLRVSILLFYVGTRTEYRVCLDSKNDNRQRGGTVIQGRLVLSLIPLHKWDRADIRSDQSNADFLKGSPTEISSGECIANVTLIPISERG